MIVFVSSENVDRPPASLLIDCLRKEGWTVEHSPRNPAEGPDGRWADWYGRGCPEAIGRADVFVAVVTPTWDSTWMAEEARLARERPAGGRAPTCYCWNPDGVRVNARGLQPYLRSPLPDDLAAVAAFLRRDAEKPGPGRYDSVL